MAVIVAVRHMKPPVLMNSASENDNFRCKPFHSVEIIQIDQLDHRLVRDLRWYYLPICTTLGYNKLSEKKLIVQCFFFARREV